MNRLSPFLRASRRAILALTLLALIPLLDGAPVVFEFAPGGADRGASAFAREIFAEVITPAGATIRLPAFFSGHGRWSIHARGDQIGEFRLGRIVEIVEGTERELRPSLASSSGHNVTAPNPRPAVTRDPKNPTRFAFVDGATYTPLGANLAWTAGERVSWHIDAFRQFAEHDLNWTRIWMCHWGALNLDWLPADMGRSPAPGLLDPRIARNWDDILAAAEEHGVYMQVVLQHHGQYTTGANANWAINPWNVANKGGFLATPGEFFTSPRALALTKQKYRYIVARWAHSPAILAWELFNEVHWTNAYRNDGNEAAVAAWHTGMAAYIRSIDPYDHLITTSLEDLRSPIYAAMDYYQPHLYAINMLTGAREFERPFDELDRPVFYGEIGDDKMPVSAAEKAGGSQLIPQIWASLMGPGPIPAQSWLGDVFLRTGRIGELGAVARFLRATDLATKPGLETFSPSVESDDTQPLRITPGYDWATHRPTTIALPLDGRDSLELNHVPGIVVGAPTSIAEGYPPQFTLELDVPRDTAATIRFTDGGARGAAAEISVDGVVVATHAWPRLPGAPASGPQPAGTPRRPASLDFLLSQGRHAVTIANTGGADWIQLEYIDLGQETPVIAAAGKRSADFIALWAWNKHGVHALAPSTRATATLLLDDVPAGTWTVTWWEADRGVPGATSILEHPGGTLRLLTPPISRHAAVVLTR